MKKFVFTFTVIFATIGFATGVNAVGSTSVYGKQESMATAELCRAAMRDAKDFTALRKFRDIQDGYRDILGNDSRNAQYRKIKNRTAVQLKNTLANSDLTLSSFCMGMLPDMQKKLVADY